MLFNTVEELKESLTSVHKNRSEGLLGFVGLAETLHLVPVLGEGLVEQLGSLPGTASAHLLALRERFRPALAFYTVLEAAPFLSLSVTDLGLTEQSTGGGGGQGAGAAPARQWVYNSFVEAAAAAADKLLDVALAWLDAHAADYAQELASSEYRSRKRLLLSTAAQLGEYVATAGSRRFFLALLPTLRQVENFELSDLLGEQLLEDLRDGLASGLAPAPDTQKLLSLVRPVLAHRALAQGVLNLNVALTGTTLRLLSDNEAVRQRQAASPEAVSALSQQATASADRYQARLVAWLDAQRPATAPAQAAELVDNSNSSSFWV
ncbi:MAG: DUF6712 family protein [Janthinobacterium lividum]